MTQRPIFHRSDHIAGYELVYEPSHTGAGSAGAERVDRPTDAVMAMLRGIGLDRLTYGAPAFVKVMRERLLERAMDLPDHELLVVEVPDVAAAEPAMVAACERLVAAGYRVALCAGRDLAGLEPLLELAYVVKLDVPTHTASDLARVVERLRAYPVQVLADRVDTWAIKAVCQKIGFNLFQGSFYASVRQPSSATLPTEWLSVARLVNMVSDLDVPDAEIQDAFREDVTLSYRLLRLVNAAGVGGRGIMSIGDALRLLGRDPVHRWLASLLVSSASQTGGVGTELTRTALIRARSCELIAEAVGAVDGSTGAFLVGLFSTLDALLGVPIERAVEPIDLAPELRNALVERQGHLAGPLRATEALEACRWRDVRDACRTLGLPEPELAAMALDAVVWARDRLAPSAG